MPKIKGSVTPKKRSDPMAGNRAPLGDQLISEEANRGLRTQPRRKQHRKAGDDEDGDAAMAGTSAAASSRGGNVLDRNMSRKLLGAVEAQQREEEDDYADEGLDLDMTGAVEEQKGAGGAPVSGLLGGAALLSERAAEELVDDDGYIDVECSPEEEAAMQAFLPDFSGAGAAGLSVAGTDHTGALGGEPQAGSLNLADLVTSAIRNKTQVIAAANEAHEAQMDVHGRELSPKVIEVYTKIGAWLKHYKAGDLPKPFKIIPSLVNWEEVVCLTSPLDWSPNAVAKATSMFASQLNARMAQRFYNMVLLPAVRQDLIDNKKLNYHYYEALKKAMFKPSAFMKGILLPVAMESCTLREAHILSSVLGKISVPVLHASATLIKMAEMSPWYGTTAIFMAVLINKKYSLPHSVIDTLVDHFYSFVEDERELPLVWHRCFLIFVQRYKNDFSPEQREKLEKHLLKVHCHSGIGPEARRELQGCVQKSLFRVPKGGRGAMDTS